MIEFDHELVADPFFTGASMPVHEQTTLSNDRSVFVGQTPWIVELAYRLACCASLHRSQVFGPYRKSCTPEVSERRSLVETLDRFEAGLDPAALCELMFAYWQNPPIFSDAIAFLETVDRPIVVVSNIDRQDIQAAIALHGLSFAEVITSEDARSYKPRPELFAAGLEAVNMSPGQVLHVGDSLTSDVAGARRAGISVAWINRSGKTPPTDLTPDYQASNLEELLTLFPA